MQIRNLILSAFGQVFFPIFFVLCFIASVVIFIRISAVTFFVKISVSELFSLYFYTMPTVLFFVVPFAFFIAACLALSRLSFDYELPVLFSLGFAPRRIVRIFLPLAAICSFCLLFLSLVLSPLADGAYKRLLSDRSTADLNLQAGQLGQKIGDWLFYVGSESGGKYGGVAIYSIKDETLILAQNAQTIIKDGIISILLENGRAYKEQINLINAASLEGIESFNIESKTKEQKSSKNPQKLVEIAEFEMLKSSFSADSLADESAELGVIEYWARAFKENRRKERIGRNLCMASSLAFLPLFSLFYFVWLGARHPRYHKNRTLIQALIALVCYLALMWSFASAAPILGIVLVPIIWCLIGFFGWRFLGARF